MRWWGWKNQERKSKRKLNTNYKHWLALQNSPVSYPADGVVCACIAQCPRSVCKSEYEVQYVLYRVLFFHWVAGAHAHPADSGGEWLGAHGTYSMVHTYRHIQLAPM